MDPSRTESDPTDALDDEDLALGPVRWRLPLGLFLATVVSTFYVGSEQVNKIAPDEVFALLRAHGTRPALHAALRSLADGWVFAVPLLCILLAHEFGHWLMARKHRVEASLPMFIPMPNLFGTMGAVISMRGQIRTRDALVDIGAAGPLAGLAVAIPVTLAGLSLSSVKYDPGVHGALIEGDSLLYLGLKGLVHGRVPPDHEVWLHPMAFAGWAGFFVTMMNLVPIGQLDGGHVAYALFGPRYDRASLWVARAMLAFSVCVALWVFVTAPDRHALDSSAFTPAIVWGFWAIAARGIFRLSGDRHPPTSDAPLSPARRRVAWLSLACLVALFMPLPLRLV